MKMPFDPAKNEINRAKHGLDLTFGADVLRDPNLIEAPGDRVDYGEKRFNALGMVAGEGLRRGLYRAG